MEKLKAFNVLLLLYWIAIPLGLYIYSSSSLAEAKWEERATFQEEKEYKEYKHKRRLNIVQAAAQSDMRWHLNHLRNFYWCPDNEVTPAPIKPEYILGDGYGLPEPGKSTHSKQMYSKWPIQKEKTPWCDYLDTEKNIFEPWLVKYRNKKSQEWMNIRVCCNWNNDECITQNKFSYPIEEYLK